MYGNYLDEVLTLRRGTADYYYHHDGQWNIVALSDTAGEVLERYEYGDFGEPEFYDAAGTPQSGSLVGNPCLFTGQRYDAETGYYWYKSRYLDPRSGRFITRDPLGLWGDPLNLGNPYTYTGNNPWSYLDPYGLCGEDQREGDNQTDDGESFGERVGDIASWVWNHPPNLLPLSDLSMPDRSDLDNL